STQRNIQMYFKNARLFQTVTPLSVALLVLPAVSAHAQLFQQHNLVSSVNGLADHLDADLVNPWGIAESGGSPFWISDNGTDKATLYNSTGTKQGLIVSVPAAPTGQVFNGGAAFTADRFIFDTEGGQIVAWKG